MTVAEWWHDISHRLAAWWYGPPVPVGYRVEDARTVEEMAERAERAEAALASLNAELVEKGWFGLADLAPAQIERLAKLIEKCGEVQLAAARALAHGYDAESVRKCRVLTRRVLLERDLGRLFDVVGELENANDLRRKEIGAWQDLREQSRCGRTRTPQEAPAQP